jgi:hypothetical protein
MDTDTDTDKDTNMKKNMDMGHEPCYSYKIA